MKTHQAPPKLHVTWYGHSAFLLQTPGGKAVLVDPWLDNPKAPAGARDVANVDLILISHGHGDHLGNTIEVAKKTGAKVISIHEVYLYLQSHGVDTAAGMNKGGTIAVDGIRVTMTDAKHSADIDVGGTVSPGGEAAGYVIQFENNYTVYHAGDTALFGDMKLIQKLYRPRVAFLPIGGLYTMSPREAAIACTFINPKHVIGMHYGTFPPLSGTPAELRKFLPGKMRHRVVELDPGQTVGLR